VVLDGMQTNGRVLPVPLRLLDICRAYLLGVPTEDQTR
jgi:hypothetical protein